MSFTYRGLTFHYNGEDVDSFVYNVYVKVFKKAFTQDKYTFLAIKSARTAKELAWDLVKKYKHT